MNSQNWGLSYPLPPPFQVINDEFVLKKSNVNLRRLQINNNNNKQIAVYGINTGLKLVCHQPGHD